MFWLCRNPFLFFRNRLECSSRARAFLVGFCRDWCRRRLAWLTLRRNSEPLWALLESESFWEGFFWNMICVSRFWMPWLDLCSRKGLCPGRPDLKVGTYETEIDFCFGSHFLGFMRELFMQRFL